MIAPKDPPARNFMLDADATRCICVLLLSDRKYMSKEEAARICVTSPGRRAPAAHFHCARRQLQRIRIGRRTTYLSIPTSRQLAFGSPLAEIETEFMSSRSISPKAVRDFYSLPQHGMAYLQEIRISEAASGRLRDGQYHLFWNNELANEQTPSTK